MWNRPSQSELANDRSMFSAIAQNAVLFILENLELLLLGIDSASIVTEIDKSIITSLKENLEIMKVFLEKVHEDLIQKKLEFIVDFVRDIAKLMEVVLVASDSLVRRKIISGDFVGHCSEVSSLVRKVEAIKVSLVKVGEDHKDDEENEDGCSWTENSSSIMEGNKMVGFDSEAKELIDKLIGGRKQLEVTSIIGMGGIGKTTLAKRLYNDPFVVYHFHVRAWTCVNPNSILRNTLGDLLACIFHDQILKMSDEDMGVKLYRSLKGRRYFIVIDNVWHRNLWNDELKMYFPDDENGSRILFTSRIHDLFEDVRCENCIYFHRFLTEDESWNLFKEKVFVDNNEEELESIGKCIVGECKGLPLAIAVIAGVLAKEKKTVKIWRDFARNVTKCREYTDILELSYKHLPRNLKSCFLFLGTFPLDYEIPVKRLTWSWMAEGFIDDIPGKRLEDVGKNHIMDLVGRSLVIPLKLSSDGGIKSCKIHDLLKQMCLQKAKEKKFMQPICYCAERSKKFRPHLRCLFQVIPDITDAFLTCKHFHTSDYENGDFVFNYYVMSSYKFLRRLELRNVLINFPDQQISELIHLRYLGLKIDCIKHQIPPSIFELLRLETCILEVEKPGGTRELPVSIWKIANLRHFHISQEMILNFPPPLQNHISAVVVLENLQTISNLCPSISISEVLARTPNLRSLGFHLTLSENTGPFSFPELAHLNLLQTIKFEYQTLGMVPFSIPNIHKFPPCLKKLTLIGSHVNWEEMSLIGMLPNLEILKVKDNFFSGPIWETMDEGFPSLMFLKLSHMDLCKWISSSDHFPRLKRLVLNDCLELEEIPFEFGDIPTLQTIEVYHSSNSTVESAKQILESQKSTAETLVYLLVFLGWDKEFYSCQLVIG
ncbi:hypothetical protein M9H77_09073 [Catharanthus roseus]|uniref:Uncharacterized protein n=1 Tax=Catharanthus roseus TaxID=4058 RepID=A0ACC0BZY0_CATRO|nr:hypothetical protein M9H77_09073 [Catharanthus roseus]